MVRRFLCFRYVPCYKCIAVRLSNITTTIALYFKPIEELDDIDNHILAILLDDGRASFSEIGEKVGNSRVAVKNRVDSLEKKIHRRI